MPPKHGLPITMVRNEQMTEMTMMRRACDSSAIVMAADGRVRGQTDYLFIIIIVDSSS